MEWKLIKERREREEREKRHKRRRNMIWRGVREKDAAERRRLAINVMEEILEREGRGRRKEGPIGGNERGRGQRGVIREEDRNQEKMGLTRI